MVSDCSQLGSVPSWSVVTAALTLATAAACKIDLAVLTQEVGEMPVQAASTWPSLPLLTGLQSYVSTEQGPIPETHMHRGGENRIIEVYYRMYKNNVCNSILNTK